MVISDLSDLIGEILYYNGLSIVIRARVDSSQISLLLLSEGSLLEFMFSSYTEFVRFRAESGATYVGIIGITIS